MFRPDILESPNSSVGSNLKGFTPNHDGSVEIEKAGANNGKDFLLVPPMNEIIEDPFLEESKSSAHCISGIN